MIRKRRALAALTAVAALGGVGLWLAPSASAWEVTDENVGANLQVSCNPGGAHITVTATLPAGVSTSSVDVAYYDANGNLVHLNPVAATSSPNADGTATLTARAWITRAQGAAAMRSDVANPDGSQADVELSTDLYGPSGEDVNKYFSASTGIGRCARYWYGGR